MRTTVSLLAEARDRLRVSLLRDSAEYAAVLLFGLSKHRDAWTGEIEERFLLHEIIELLPEDFLERTPVKLTLSTTPFFNSIKTAVARDLVVGFIHSHPNGPLAFSPFDDVSDQELMTILEARVEGEARFLSMVMDQDGHLIGRAFNASHRKADGTFVHSKAQMVRVLGDRWEFSRPHEPALAAIPAELDRQLRAFGAKSTQTLAHLRVGLVGCGGTGSAVAMLLARIGVGHIALFDHDTVDRTNLNRLHFATKSDAILARRKVDVVAEGIASIGMDTKVVRFPYAVDTPEAKDGLLCCDVVFGCTDDHLGRNVLNRVSRFYLIPIIDLGLLIEPTLDGYSTFDGRVTVVQPGSACQVCRGLIDSNVMLAESLRRGDPELHQQRRLAGYVVDAPDPSPVVVTFTTELASMAVNELFQRLNGYRGADGSCAERVRRFSEVKDADTVPGGRPRPGCPLCDRRRYDALGDVEPFLDQV
jgi:molybdopterin/thiamine biosynthesis adenylyltransferase